MRGADVNIQTKSSDVAKKEGFLFHLIESCPPLHCGRNREQNVTSHTGSCYVSDIILQRFTKSPDLVWIQPN